MLAYLYIMCDMCILSQRNGRKDLPVSVINSMSRSGASGWKSEDNCSFPSSSSMEVLVSFEASLAFLEESSSSSKRLGCVGYSLNRLFFFMGKSEFVSLCVIWDYDDELFRKYEIVIVVVIIIEESNEE